MSLRTRPNSWVALDANPTTQLTYAPLVQPAPLTASLSLKSPTYATVEVVITNNTSGSLDVQSISFSFQVGEGGSVLTPTTEGIQTAVSDPATWSVQGPGTITEGTATYTLQPAVGASVTLVPGGTVVVQIYQIQANVAVGTAIVVVDEVLQSSSGQTSFGVTTFPYGFFFDGLTVCTGSGSSLVPVAQVGENQTVTLTWNGSVVDTQAYTILYSDAAGGQQLQIPKVVGEWVSPPLTSDTVFTLIVKTNAVGGAPLVASMSTTVSVRNPVLIATSLRTSGDVTATGHVNGIGICPPGTVIMFAGDINDKTHFDTAGTGVAGTPYAGWQICNGNNGAPDLRDKFIAGAGKSYTVKQQGGQDSVVLTIAQLAAHSHFNQTGGSAPYLNYQGVYYNSQGVSRGIMYNNSVSDPNGNRPNLLTTRGLPEIQVNNHTHSIPMDGSNQPHENRPQFVALGYLMKL